MEERVSLPHLYQTLDSLVPNLDDLRFHVGSRSLHCYRHVTCQMSDMSCVDDNYLVFVHDAWQGALIGVEKVG